MLRKPVPAAAPGGSTPRTVLLAALAAVGLNALLSLEAAPDAPWVRPVAAASPDLLLVVLVACCVPVAARTGPFASPVLTSAGQCVLSVLLFTAALVRFGDRVARELLGRPLDAAGDLPHLGNVAGMLFGEASLALWAPLVGIGALAAAGLVHAALGALASARIRASRGLRYSAALLSGLLLLAPAVHPPGGSAFLTAASVASDWFAPEAEITEPPLPEAPDLGNADLLLVFVESYGVAAFEDARRRVRLEAAAGRLADDAAVGGFDFRSAQVQSPTFGGGSWKAHAALLSGVWVDGEDRYRALVRSDRESLVKRFAAAGYRTAAFEPGIQGLWPEGDWYGFEAIYDASRIGYAGPPIGWWTIPDQFTLYALHNEELAAADRPVFAKVSLITSHIPYWPVPPYVTPWNRFDDGTAYDGPLRSVAHDDARNEAELSERYATSLEHQFRILGGFLRGFVPRRALVAVIGDHQPPRLSLHDSDTWATPIHLFSQDPELLSPFETLGFARTLIPRVGTSWRMSDFPRDLSALFPRR